MYIKSDFSKLSKQRVLEYILQENTIQVFILQNKTFNSMIYQFSVIIYEIY